MKLSRTAIVIPLAGLLLVGGAGAVFAATATPAAPTAPAAPAVDQPTPAPAASTKPLIGRGLTNVLDGLVAKGTITAAQETAIVDALSSQRAERRAEVLQIRGFLADGQITQDELNQLPADSPLRTLSSLMADGKITIAELQTLGRGWMRTITGGGNGQGMGRGMVGNGFGQGPAVTPTP